MSPPCMPQPTGAAEVAGSSESWEDSEILMLSDVSKASSSAPFFVSEDFMLRASANELPFAC
eukprot:758058-Hanusia_phi.AAC.1